MYSKKARKKYPRLTDSQIRARLLAEAGNPDWLPNQTQIDAERKFLEALPGRPPPVYIN